MPVAITTLRSDIATILTNAGVLFAFRFPHPNTLANSVIVAPSDPYLTPSNNSQNSLSTMASFKIIMTVPMFDNQGNLAGIEDTIVAVFNKLANSSLVFNVGTVSAPAVLDVASGALLTSDLNITVLVNWS